MAHPAVTSAIIGTGILDRLEDLLDGVEVPLSDETLDAQAAALTVSGILLIEFERC